MENSVLEAMLGRERADALVSFVADDIVKYVETHLGVEDEMEVFDSAIDKAVAENAIVQMIQMSDDDAISEFGIRVAVELEAIARGSDDEDQGMMAVRSRLATHFANWLMSTNPDEFEMDDEVE